MHFVLWPVIFVDLKLGQADRGLGKNVFLNYKPLKTKVVAR